MILKNLVAVVTAAILASQTLFTVAAPVKKVNKRLLLPTAPLASDVNGAHLLLKNDVDSSNIIKNAYMLLSVPRDYYSAMSACTSMGDGKEKVHCENNWSNKDLECILSGQVRSTENIHFCHFC